MMSDDQILEVVQAHKEGKQIQSRGSRDRDYRDDWGDCEQLRWDFWNLEYRVKPEPRKPREWWLLNEGDYAIGCSSKKETQNRYFTKDREMIRVREVIDD